MAVCGPRARRREHNKQSLLWGGPEAREMNRNLASGPPGGGWTGQPPSRDSDVQVCEAQEGERKQVTLVIQPTGRSLGHAAKELP